MNRNDFGGMTDELWAQIQPHLPRRSKKTGKGRPPTPDRVVMSGIVFRLRTGCQWKAIPKQFGSGSTCHRRFQSWRKDGVFRAVFVSLVGYYDGVRGIADVPEPPNGRRGTAIDWQWASLDSATVKSPKGGDCTGPNPTDRAKLGVKRHVLTDGRGVPLAVAISAANVHDKRAAIPTLDAIVIRHHRQPRRPLNLCLDKGYDFPDIDAAVRRRKIRPHIRHRGESKRSCRRGKARRWVVERTNCGSSRFFETLRHIRNSWHNRFRCLLVRWERKAANYCGLVHLACGLIAFQQAGGLP